MIGMLQGMKVLLLMLMVAGCSPFPKSVLQQVDERLTYEEVQRDPDSFIGKKILWGGVIIKTTNTPIETIMKIRQTDLDIDTRPKNLDKSQGRFLVRYHGFLDPAIYAEGREITLLGEITGKEDMVLDQTSYTYPVIRSEGLHLWEKREIYPYYDPWFRHYYPSPWYYRPFPYRWYRW